MKTNRIVLLLLAVMFSISALFSQQTKSRIIENGGTGKYSAIMLSDASLPTHTIFRPADISTFTKKHKLPLIVWGNGACFNSPWNPLSSSIMVWACEMKVLIKASSSSDAVEFP